MFKSVLIATDGSELSKKAIATGIGLAKALGAKVTGVTVTPSWASIAPGEAAIGFPIDEYIRAMQENAKAILKDVAEASKEAGIECTLIHKPDQLAADGILSAAESMKCDLIVMSSHGRRGLQRLFLGSQAQEVLTRSSIPVLICR